MRERKIGVIMNGVTGRMGTNQHLIRSILAIRDQGGVRLDSGEVIMPEPILGGRNPDKLEALAEAHGLQRVSTDLDACLSDPHDKVYFDAQRTDLRFQQRADELQNGGLAGSVRPDETVQRLQRHLKRHVDKRFETAERMRNSAQFDCRRGNC